MIRLIADSGSTKVDWRAIMDDGSVKSINTEGINPVFLEDEKIVSIFTEFLLPELGPDVDELYFYGAGIVDKETIDKLTRCFVSVFPHAKCEVASDMLAAARALCGTKPGIACILGTGANSCFYTGEGIDASINVRCGGFILGDEASGAYLGKRLLSDFIKGLLPPVVEKEFVKRYGLDYPAIVKKVYREPMPGRFLASFSPFINEFKNQPYMTNLLKSSFNEFLMRNIVHYDYKRYEVNFVGSIAYYYQDILSRCVTAAGMRMGKVLKSPAEGLVEFHKRMM